MFRSCLFVCLAVLMAFPPAFCQPPDGFSPIPYLDDPIWEDMGFPLDHGDPPGDVSQYEIDLLKGEVASWNLVDRTDYQDQLDAQLAYLATLIPDVTTQAGWDLVDAIQERNADAHNAIYGFAGAAADNDRAGRRLDMAQAAKDEGNGHTALVRVNEAYEYLNLRAWDEHLAEGWFWEAEELIYELEMEISEAGDPYALLNQPGGDGLRPWVRPAALWAIRPPAWDPAVVHQQAGPGHVVGSPGTPDPLPVVASLAGRQPAGLDVHRAVPSGVRSQLSEPSVHG